MQKKYSALRLIANLFRGFGILVAAGGGLIAVLSLCTSTMARPMAYEYGETSIVALLSFSAIGGVLAFFMAALTGLGLYAFGELIMLLIAVEENTRASTVLLNRWLRQGDVGYTPRKNDEAFVDDEM